MSPLWILVAVLGAATVGLAVFVLFRRATANDGAHGVVAGASGGAAPLYDVTDFDDHSTVTDLSALELAGAVPYHESRFRPEEPTATRARYQVTAAALSDVGKKRDHNEDSYLCLHEKLVYAVADGVGGEAGGEVASRLAVEALDRCFERSGAPPVDSRAAKDVPRLARELVSAIGNANADVRAESKSNRRLSGMGTTMVALRFAPRHNRAFVAHVGDSRCYRLRDGRLVQLTKDHTMGRMAGAKGAVAEKLAWALGTGSNVQVEVQDDVPILGDLYVLCSDGLSKMVERDRMVELLERHRSDVDACVRALVDEANANGGEDNVTVVVARVDAPTA